MGLRLARGWGSQADPGVGSQADPGVGVSD